MTLKWRTFTIPILSLFFLLGCDSYEKIRKSSDMELKEEKAQEYYNNGEYDKAIPLFKELVNVHRGTKDIQELYYYYAYSYFGKQSYLMAAYHFKKLATTYPKSQYAEESQFMYAYSYYLLSPRHTLDQDYTHKAIQAFQLFANKYPNSDRLTRCNKYIDKLRKKLKKKALYSAKTYYKIGHYKAATVALSNVLNQYPDIRQQEKINFLILKSHYLLAQNSIPSKQKSRYKETLEVYHAFKEEYPDTKFANEVQNIYFNTKEYLKEHGYDRFKKS